MGSGTPTAWAGTDAGGPDSGADTFQFAIKTGPEDGPPLPGPTGCWTFRGTFPTGFSLFPNFTNETGDLVVADTRPFRTSKDQCKNDAWRDFSVFKNQGDCVRFVATGGRNPSAVRERARAGLDEFMSGA